MLESDYAATQAVETLQQVHDGNLPFDRTMRISTAEENAKDKVARRIPVNLATIRRLLELNQRDWEELQAGDVADGDRRRRPAEGQHADAGKDGHQRPQGHRRGLGS